MKFLTLQRVGGQASFSRIRIVDADVSLPLPFTSWAIDSADRLNWTRTRLIATFRKEHLSGTYEGHDGAVYVYDHDEMLMLLCKGLGETDEERVHRLQCAKKAESFDWGEFFDGLLAFLWALIRGAAKCIGIMILIPIIIHFFGKRRHH